jgi:acetyltransferase-like isoleucine patch superfamily enzyme
MLKKIYCFFRDFRGKIKLMEIVKSIKKKVTLIGDNQSFRLSSRVELVCGSVKEDVVLHEHVDMFGRIYSYSGGKVIMHEWSKIGRGSTITAVNRVEIGKDTAIATGVTIIDNNTHPLNPEDRRYMRHTPHGSKERQNQHSANAPIIIGENVWIGSNARIQKGVTIGDNSIIAANSVVTHDVPANAIAAGNPAKIVKTDIDKTTTPIFPLK